MKKRFICFSILAVFLFVKPVSAINYTFTGNGNWLNPANWAGGQVPPPFISAGIVVTINGNALVDGYDYDNGYDDGLYEVNGGSLIVSSGATLKFFHTSKGFILSSGSFDVFGNFINHSVFDFSGNVSINISGTVKNELLMSGTGRVIINSGGTLNNLVAFYSSNLTINPGGTFINTGKLNGNSTINGSLINSGTLAPGYSPGVYTITGNYTANVGSVHNFEIGGTSSGSYDQLNTSGTVSLSGTLNVSLINGFVPTGTHDLPIITGSVSGTFSTVNIPSSYTLIYNSNSVVLRHLTILPVTFISVDAKEQGNKNQIKWKVANEENVNSYEVEKSLNGNSFTKIGEVKAAAQPEYNFKDERTSQRVYYRIKAVDMDGKYKYSSIINFNQNKSGVVARAFPLPATNAITIQHPIISDGQIRISSVDGKLIKTISVNNNSQETKIDISSFKHGVYLIQYEVSSGKTETIKIVK